MDKIAEKLPSISDIHTIILDFDGIFTNNKVYVNEDGGESVCCDRRDGLAFDLIRAYKNKKNFFPEIFILSSETNKVVLSRANKMGVECKFGESDKLKYVEKYLSLKFPNTKNPFQGLVYLGNDLNDFQVMKKAGFTVAPSDAHNRILDIADIVIPIEGGNGFFREFVEILLGFKSLTEEEFNEFISNS